MQFLKIGHVILNSDRIEAVATYPHNHEVSIRTFSGAVFTFKGKDADEASAMFEPPAPAPAPAVEPEPAPEPEPVPATGPEVVANAGDETHDPQFAAA